MRSFFIVNAWRTGSTLLAAILGAHPRIVTLIESRWFANISCYLKRLQRIPPGRRPEIMYKFLTTAQLMDQLSTSPDTLWTIVLRYYGSPDRILPVLMAEFAQRTKPSAALWGEKSCLHSLYIPHIDHAYPDTRFIHLVRDPRATVNSIAKPSFADASNDWCVAAHAYRRFNEAIELSLGRIVPERHMRLHYEDLVSRPEEELARCCAFLGVEFDSAMLAHERARRNFASVGSETAARKMTAAFVSEWKTSLSPTQVRCIERFTSHLHSTSHYARSNPKTRRFAYLLTLAILQAKDLCLRLVESLVHMARGRPFVWSRLGIHLRVTLGASGTLISRLRRAHSRPA